MCDSTRCAAAVSLYFDLTVVKQKRVEDSAKSTVLFVCRYVFFWTDSATCSMMQFSSTCDQLLLMWSDLNHTETWADTTLSVSVQFLSFVLLQQLIIIHRYKVQCGEARMSRREDGDFSGAQFKAQRLRLWVKSRRNELDREQEGTSADG